MENIIFEYENIIISSETPTLFYFSDNELDWYQTIDLEDTDSFIEFMDQIKSTYGYVIFDEIDELFKNIIDL